MLCMSLIAGRTVRLKMIKNVKDTAFFFWLKKGSILLIFHCFLLAISKQVAFAENPQMKINKNMII